MHRSVSKFLLDVVLFTLLGFAALTSAVTFHVIPSEVWLESDSAFLGIRGFEWLEIHLAFVASLVTFLVYYGVRNFGAALGETKHHFGPLWKVAVGVVVSTWFALILVVWLVATSSAGMSARLLVN